MKTRSSDSSPILREGRSESEKEGAWSKEKRGRETIAWSTSDLHLGATFFVH